MGETIERGHVIGSRDFNKGRKVLGLCVNMKEVLSKTCCQICMLAEYCDEESLCDDARKARRDIIV